ncbi:MAG: type III-A CRISPR-associated protein Csm2 [bacterium]
MQNQERIWTEQQIEQIINGDTKQLVATAEKLGKDLCDKKDERGNILSKGMTKSQIRNIFNSVKQMEMKGFNPKDLLLLKPKLAYAAVRPGATNGTRVIKDILTKAIDKVGDDAKKFDNFCNFFEAILAYHRAAGGK